VPLESNHLCALTQKVGRPVKSHIIPLALTRLSRTGEKHLETGIGYGVKKRANSWYDNALVTREGEDILAAIDAIGIDQLRKHKLVWSSWGKDIELKSNDQSHENGIPAHRSIKFDKAECIQLLLLSILWRAAASNRPEFKEIVLERAVLEDLRLKVVAKNPGDFSEYPIQLFQISSLGVIHNRTPLLEVKEIADSNQTPKETIEYARLYFDGFVAHIHLPRGAELSNLYLRACLSQTEETIVFLHKFEDSRAQANIVEMVQTVHKEMTNRAG